MPESEGLLKRPPLDEQLKARKKTDKSHMNFRFAFLIHMTFLFIVYPF
jgi:hypothetical protein